ncbi:MAG: hypothetical protein ACI8XO_004185, partial [Verrucomicrobiales bacterium]
MLIALDSRPLTIRFGGDETVCEHDGDSGSVQLSMAIPSLGENHSESVAFFDEGTKTETSQHGDFYITRGNGWIAGCVARTAEFPLEAPSLQLYRDLLEIVGDDKPIYRIWNYLPDINGKTDGLEN